MFERIASDEPVPGGPGGRHRDRRIIRHMATSDSAPAGYCPRCGYRMDPGTCPECGLTVTPATLGKRPPHVRRRRWRIAFVFVALVIGGYVVFQRVDWIPLLPDRVLLAVHGGVDDPFTRELLARHAAGSLPSERSNELFDALVDSRRLSVRSPYPSGYRVKIEFTLGAKAPPNTIRCAVGSCEVIVDSVRTNAGSSTILPGGASVELPPMEVGTHTIEVVGYASVWTATPKCFHAFPFHLSETVEIVDRPIVEFVQPIWNEQCTRSIETCAYVSAYDRVYRVPNSRPETMFEFHFVKPTVPIAFRALARPVDREDWTEVHGQIVIPRNANRGYRTASFVQLAGAMRLDVKLVPSAEVALMNGLTEYFAGELSWDGLEVLTGGPDGGFPSQRARRPDGILRNDGF